MMPIVITTAVRTSVAPDAARPAADELVLADLTTWTLVPTSGKRRSASFVWMFGRRFRYTARLQGFELPDGWCVCPGSVRGDCVCRDAPDASAQAAIVLTGAKPISARDRELVSTGDSYDTPLAQRPSVTRSSWWPEAAARWQRTQARVRRTADDAEDPMRRWAQVVKVRRMVVEELAQPLPYDAVDLEDETGLLVFSLAGDVDRAAVPPDVIYEPAGHRKVAARLRTLDVDEDGRFRCEVEPPGDPVEIADFADGLYGARRRLVRDQEATSTVLEREEHVMRDVLGAKAVNPQLLALLRCPEEARLDEWLPAPEHLFQPELDDAQRRALEHALRARSLLVVQGPPGTGKTTFIAELVLQHLHRHPADTVLMAAQTNQAIDNVLLRVHRVDPEIPLVRIGADERKIDPRILPFRLNATEPWRAGVRLRAERFRRYALACAELGEWDARTVAEMLAVQDEYLGGEGAKQSVQERLLDARVVAGTCYGVSKSREVRDGTYALAVVEEAGKARPTEALMAMLRAHKIVLVGDSHQLPPNPDRALEHVLRRVHRGEVVEPLELQREAALLMTELAQHRERLLARGEEPPPEFNAETLFHHVARRLRKDRPALEVTLTTQYRMVSGIGELISHCFYEGNLRHGRLNRRDEGRDARALRAGRAHVRIVDVDGREQTARGSTSAYNVAEVAAVVAELRRLNAIAANSLVDGRLEVAVITGYAAQLRSVNTTLKRKTFHALKIRTGLVDRFQGDEEEVVIFSATRTLRPGFLRDRARINVAFSRARSLLVVCAAAQRARDGGIGKPLRDVIAFVDERLADGDDRYEVVRDRNSAR